MSKYETLGRSLLPPLEAGWSLGGRIGAKLEGWIRCWALGATGRQQGWPKWVEVAQVEKEPPQQIPRQPLPRNPSSVFCNNKYCYFLVLKTLACKLLPIYICYLKRINSLFLGIGVEHLNISTLKTFTAVYTNLKEIL